MVRLLPNNEQMSDYDFSTADGRVVVEVKKGAHGVRTLHGSATQLALFLKGHAEVELACLVLLGTRLSSKRLETEWRNLISVFDETVSPRLALIVIEDDRNWFHFSDHESIPIIAEHFLAEATKTKQPNAAKSVRKSDEIFKSLLRRWLLQLGPIPIGKQGEDVGCSYRTVRKALDQLSIKGHLGLTSSRSVELVEFPYIAWEEHLILSRKTRAVVRYRDMSGSRPDPERLLKRLKKLQPKRFAVGGVVAARHWHSDFDLNGVPRVDLLCDVSEGSLDLDFVRKLDPALKTVEEPTSNTLVIHSTIRSTAFENLDDQDMPLSDPVETVLHLHDMGLSPQAMQLMRHLRPDSKIR